MKSHSLYSIKQSIWLVVAGTVLWIVFQAIVLHRLDIEWSQAFMDAAVSGILLAGLSAGTVTVYRFYQPGSSNRLYRFIYAVGIAALFALGVKSILSYLFKEDSMYLVFLEKSMPIRFITSFLVLAFITLLNWMWNVLKDQKEQ